MSIVARPAELDVTVWRGSTHTVELDFPAGMVDDTWTAEVVCDDGTTTALDTSVSGDTLTVTFEPPVTDAFDVCCQWFLYDGDGEARIVGDFETTEVPGPATTSATVTIEEQEITVILGDGADDVAAAVAAHEAEESAHGWQEQPSQPVFGTPILWPDGPVWTLHDAKYWWPRDWFFDGGYVDNGGTLHAPDYVTFDPDVVERIKWLWVPGDGWTHYTVRAGLLAPLAPDGDVVLRYYERRFTVDADQANNGSLVDTPVLVDTATATVPSAFGSGNWYQDVATDVVAPGALTMILSVIDRFATDSADTDTGDAGIFVTTATRTDGP